VAAEEGRLKRLCLPPYSPHLDPEEQGWGNVKARPAKRTVTGKDDLLAKVIRASRRLRKLNGAIHRFFRHPHCRYIGYAKLAV
jgi:hypothetical protein